MFAVGGEAMKSESRQRNVRSDLYWGLRWGAYYGGFYGLLMLVVILFTETELAPESGWSDWTVLLVYVTLCLGIGAVVGLLRPLTTTWWGTAFIGLLVGGVLGLGFGGLLMGADFGNPGYAFVVPACILVTVLGSLAIRFSHNGSW